MKKYIFIAILALMSGLVATTQAYTGSDCDVAEDLADEGIIKDNNGRCQDYRLDDMITRQEVAGVALTIADACETIRSVPSTSYRCENVFLDVGSTNPNTWVCRVAETLAENDIITTSRRDRFGRPYFHPTRYVSKAEALGMMMDAGGIEFRNTTYSPAYNSYGSDTVAWQKPLIEEAYQLDIISTRSSFYPNKYARRSEVFDMALEVLRECDGTGRTGGGSSRDVEVRINDITVDEDDDYAQIPVVLSDELDEDLEVRWRTHEDTAEDNDDYQDDSGTLIIRAGDIREEIRIRLEDDNRKENTERFYVEIYDVDTDDDRYVSIEDDRGYVNIRDDDSSSSSSGDIEITVDNESVDEDDDEVKVEFCLSETAEGDVEIDWETRDGTADEDDDYEPDDGTVVIDRGERCEDISIDIIDDNRDEGSEYFYVEITDADSDDRDDDLEIVDDRATITIRDDERGGSSSGDIEVRIDDIDVDEDDDEAIVTISLSEEADGDVEIRWRTRDGSADEGDDYEDDSGVLTIREGDKREDIRIDLIDDHEAEVTEYFYIEIYDVDIDGGSDDIYIDDDRGTVTIHDDDGNARYGDDEVELRIDDETADEDDDEIEFVVRLSEEADDDIYIDWRTREDSARDDEDYHHDSGRVVIREGDTTARITIDLIDDNRREGLERFYLEIYDIDFDGDDDLYVVDGRANGFIRDDD